MNKELIEQLEQELLSHSPMLTCTGFFKYISEKEFEELHAVRVELPGKEFWECNATLILLLLEAEGV